MSERFERFEVPSEGWHDMADAPRDGSIFAVCYRAWNNPANPLAIQMAQWLPFAGGVLCAPYNVDSHVYADGWMTLDELNTVLGIAGGVHG